jgi:hypothetical protein
VAEQLRATRALIETEGGDLESGPSLTDVPEQAEPSSDADRRPSPAPRPDRYAEQGVRR